MPEGQPKLKVFQPLLGGAVRLSPPGLDGEIPRHCLKHRGYVAILDAKTFVLVLQVVLDIKFGVFLQRLGPMEVTSSLVPIDKNLWISTPVVNFVGIAMDLHIVCHESFEVRLGNLCLAMLWLKLCQKNTLKVAANDGHDALVGSVVYVAGQGGPLGDAFDMVGYDPNMLEIPTILHLLNQINSTIKVDFGHLQNTNFIRRFILAHELNMLDIGPSADTSKLGDAIHNS